MKENSKTATVLSAINRVINGESVWVDVENVSTFEKVCSTLGVSVRYGFTNLSTGCQLVYGK